MLSCRGKIRMEHLGGEVRDFPGHNMRGEGFKLGGCWIIRKKRTGQSEKERNRILKFDLRPNPIAHSLELTKHLLCCHSGNRRAIAAAAASAEEQGQIVDYALVHHHQARDFVSDFPDPDVLLAKLALELQDPEPKAESRTSNSTGGHDIVDELHRTPLALGGRGAPLELPGAVPAP